MIVDEIKQKLETTLHPQLIEIIDNTSAHAGHIQSGGHYHVTIVADVFTGKSLVQRHKLVYQALGEMMKETIHALGITALTPSEQTQ